MASVAIDEISRDEQDATTRFVVAQGREGIADAICDFRVGLRKHNALIAGPETSMGCSLYGCYVAAGLSNTW